MTERATEPATDPSEPAAGLVPAHVLAAFQGEPGTPQPAGHAWDNGWRIGANVYSRAGDYAGWAAKIREKLKVDGARVARPVRSTDGRFVVAGWQASTWIPGELMRRVDETVAVALRLSEALAELPGPAADTVPDDDPFTRADRLAWEETGPQYREIGGPVQLGHADLLTSTVFQGTQAPTITGLVPFPVPRPASYTAALVIVDGLVAGAVDDAVIDRFAHLPDLDQLLLRALAYRRHVNELHPGANQNTRSHLERVADLLASRASATI
ncbi:TIGR02569 family protein [Corynebacterium halotolerans]|uniref:TIGR02569 family protein n=1 Tax=Corynebacterium halotolerans YIM 70093 = DSM 44683 TaxID=1121362 RepID=M1P533_9CORY|nr:TIGR02569 family protein [Corynebacterium halotolerans]AGF71781.1 hypothetical protein A605_03850 [Corynebacterium halotolerans YIM 70093 = DSM 44683]